MDEPLPLLATKLYIPPPRRHVIARLRLVQQLQAGLQGKLTLISAPAGFGKTTLVSAWQATLTGSAGPLGWISLDAGDQEPLRFWSYVALALDRLLPGAGSTALAQLQASYPPPIETIVLQLLNALSALTTDMVLVLDDYHLIDTLSIHQTLVFLIDHLPPRLHLAIITRTDPPLPLSRWRSRGELTELRANELRFTTDEAAAYLDDVMGLMLSPGDLAALNTRTEGWIAGLQFAAIAMRGRDDPQVFITTFTGSHRFVMDYLIEEVLSRQPAHLQTFLLETAILDRMCGALCDAVILGAGVLTSEHAYSQTLLEELERANLFVVPLDDERRWYRYHHLFAEFLRQRLSHGATREQVRTLHVRAAEWYAGKGLDTEAIAHALEGEDWEHAADLIEGTGLKYIFVGQVRTVLGWLSRLPENCVATHPRLCLLYALGLGDTRRPAAAETWLEVAEKSIEHASSTEEAGALHGEVILIRAMIVRSMGDLARCVALSRQGLDLLPARETIRRAGARLNVARGYMVSGDVSSAAELLALEVIEPARASGNAFAAVAACTNLARLQKLQGRLHAAAATYDRLRSLATGLDGIPVLGDAGASYFVGLAELHYEWNALSRAEQLLRQGLAIVTGPLTVDADVVLQGYLLLARLEQSRGNYPAASAALATCVDLAHQMSFVAQCISSVVAAQAWLALSQGHLTEAMRWADGFDQPTYVAREILAFSHELEYLTLVRVRLAQGRTAMSEDTAIGALRQALAVLDRLLESAQAGSRNGSLIVILILQAQVQEAKGDTRGALAALEQALVLAAPQGYIRSLADEGEPLAALLAKGLQDSSWGRGRRDQSSVRSYAMRLLDACGNGRPEGAAEIVEALTTRELEVLRLMVAGRSNAEIAKSLVVAVSTVKSHANSIFGKLGVTSRAQAIALAHERNLV